MTNRATIPLFQAVAIMEALANPNHYQHEQALLLMLNMREQVQKESVKIGGEMMQKQWDNMTPAEANDFWNTWCA